MIPSNRSLDVPSLNPTAAAQLAAIIESSVDAIVSKQLDGTVRSWNRSAERIFGYSAEEMVGNSIYRLIPEDLHDEEAEILKRAARGEQITHYETTRIRKDGNRITISLTVSPVFNPDGTIAGVASIKRDITESRRLEQALRQSAKMEAIGRLAGGLAHDFNNNLHALSGFAHLIGRDPTLSPTARQDLLQIHKVAERMASLTHQLLAFARQQVLAPKTVDLSDNVADALPMLQRLIGSNYTLDLEQGRGKRWVRVDPGQLVQVLMNLVTNARDAMPDGGKIRLRTATRVIADDSEVDLSKTPIPTGTFVVLEVADHGVGISPQDLAHLFEPFFTTKEVGQGTGLGLATVEGIVSQSKGHLQVDTALGAGTTFRILFPLSDPPLEVKGSSASAEAKRANLERIVVVDDDENVRNVVARLLELEGYSVVQAANGAEALAYLEQNGAVELVITDVVMPVMGGQELTERLKRHFPTVPTIWMSGHPTGTGPVEIHAKPGQPFLQKPITPANLFDTVRSAIGSYRV
jgi:two-component system, cell cycle sensor histidine kinase and response regulator CckA